MRRRDAGLWLLAVLLALPAAAQEHAPFVPLRGRLVEGVASARDPGETYTLYLPERYSPERRWPALLIFDPRGRSALAAELFRDAAETYGWILLSAGGTRSDGPMEPNRRALAALWPEVHERYATDPRSDPELSVRRLLVELRISDLHKRAAEPGYGGTVARRLLETLFTQTYFYLTRDAIARGDSDASVKTLTVAGEVKPERPDVWYRLARALTRAGSRKPALEALEKALAAGFADRERLESDPDLEPLRRMEGYRRLMAGLGG